MRIELPKLKKTAKAKIKEKFLEKAKMSSSRLEVQGDLAKLCEEEKSEIDWKAVIYKVPKGVMAFACRAATNSLATPDNLAKWGKIVDPRCKLCTHSPCTLGHVLSHCKVALDQDRLTYRHDSILSYLLTTLSSSPGLEDLDFYSDLKGWKTSGGSIPASIMVTGQRPDLVLVDRRTSPFTVHLVELTVPWDSTRSIEAARSRKVDRYTSLCSDIKKTGLKCHIHTLEIGARGFIDSRNRGTLTFLCHLAGFRRVRQVQQTCSKLAMLGSKVIFNARNSLDWSAGALLKP
jgi:hypothetical protein